LTLLAQGTLPDLILLEDAEDLSTWFAALGRTVESSWADDVRAAGLEAWADSIF